MHPLTRYVLFQDIPIFYNYTNNICLLQYVYIEQKTPCLPCKRVSNKKELFTERTSGVLFTNQIFLIPLYLKPTAV